MWWDDTHVIAWYTYDGRVRTCDFSNLSTICNMRAVLAYAHAWVGLWVNSRVVKSSDLKTERSPVRFPETDQFSD